MDRKKGKKRKLEMAVATIHCRFGPRSLVRGRLPTAASAPPNAGVPYIPTGFPKLDRALAVGGLPKGKVTELLGLATSGKTTLAIKFLEQAQAGGGQVAYGWHTGADLNCSHPHWDADLLRTMIGVTGGEENFAAASPINHVRPGLSPALIIHGDADQTIPVEQAINFDVELQRAGVPSRLIICLGGGHSQLLFSALAEKRAQIVVDIADFVYDCTRS